MSGHMKKHPISAHGYGSTLYVRHERTTYAIPKKIANQYVVEEKKLSKLSQNEKSIEQLFEQLDKKYTRAGALLKGLRLRERMSQVEFAQKIELTQANLSSMENGHRPIGKKIAKRIEKIFGINYRYFLE